MAGAVPKRRLSLALLASLLLGCAGEHARVPEPLLTPPVIAVPRAATPPRIDATLDDPAWERAARIPNLTLSLGDEGQGLTPMPSEVRLLWDADWLYLRFICADEKIDAPFAEHDANHYLGDVVEVFIDAKGDQRQWIELQVNPHNATFDQLTTLSGEPIADELGRLQQATLSRDYWTFPQWTLTGWRTATRINQQDGKPVSWIADLALPAKPLLRRLGIDHFKPMTLRANLLRYEWLDRPHGDQPRTLMAMNWAPVAYGCPHISPAAMGTLHLVIDP